MTRAGDGWQTTVRGRIRLSGVGVHSGQMSNLVIHPTDADTGICFVRTDLGQDDERIIPAVHRHTAATELATVIGDPHVAAVSTVEHVLAALFGCGVDNAIVEVDGPEVPILDGSAQPFADAIEAVGVRKLDKPRRYIEVVKPIRVDNGAQFAELKPHDGFRLDVEIDFAHEAIGRQRVIFEVTPDVFRKELAGARTFGFYADLDRLRAAGFALGADLSNAVVVTDDGVMNDDGLRWSDEFVRHKALDVVGDLALAGLPIKGAYRSVRGGHRLNSAVLEALFADPTAWRYVEAPVNVRRPARQRAAAGGFTATQAAYTPDR